MFDLVKKGVFAGIGVGLMTKEKVEELARKLAGEAKLSEAEGRRLAEELLSQSKEAKTSLEEMLEKRVEVVLNKIGIPTHADLRRLEEKVDKLAKLAASGKERDSDS